MPLMARSMPSHANIGLNERCEEDLGCSGSGSQGKNELFEQNSIVCLTLESPFSYASMS